MSNYTHLNNIAVQGSIESSAQGKLIGSFDTMPAASSLNAGQIVLYTGATGTYVQGKYYVSNGTSWVISAASPSAVTVDSALSDTSINPVQNKVIKAALDEKVDAEAGKGLSTNDYTTAEKTKLAGIEAGAQVNKVTDITVNGATVVGADKVAAIDLSNYATKGDVSSIPKFAISVVTELPSSGISTSTIYLKSNGGSSGNVYDEYLYVNGAWEKIGTTEVDLSGYVPKTTTVNNKQLNANITLTAEDVGALSAGGTAVKATADANGNNIANTYATQTALTNGLAAKQNALTFDSAPTSGSSNPVTSGGIFSAINNVSSAIAGKQDALTFDSTPTSGSGNPVTSDGIYNALKSSQSKQPIIRFTKYNGTIPVESGCSYSTNGNDWVDVTEDSQITKPFTGWVKFNTIVQGSAYTAKSNELSPDLLTPYDMQTRTIQCENWNYAHWLNGVGIVIYLGNSSKKYLLAIQSYDADGNPVNQNIFDMGTNGSLGYGDNSSNIATADDGKYVYCIFNGNGVVYKIDKDCNCSEFATIPTNGSDAYFGILCLNGKTYVAGADFNSTLSEKGRKLYIIDSQGMMTSIAGAFSYNISKPMTYTNGDVGFICGGWYYGGTSGRSGIDKISTIDSNDVVTYIGTLTDNKWGGTGQKMVVFRGKGYLLGFQRNIYSSYSSYSDSPYIYAIDYNGISTNVGTMPETRLNAYICNFRDEALICCGGYHPKYSSSSSARYYDTVYSIDKNDVITNPCSITYKSRSGDCYIVNGILYLFEAFTYDSNKDDYYYQKYIERLDLNFIYTYTLTVPVTNYSEYIIDGEGSVGTQDIAKTYTKTSEKTKTDPEYSWKYVFKYENGNITSS